MPWIHIPAFGHQHENKNKLKHGVLEHSLEFPRICCIIQALSYLVTYHVFITTIKFIPEDILFIRPEAHGVVKIGNIFSF